VPPVRSLFFPLTKTRSGAAGDNKTIAHAYISCVQRNCPTSLSQQITISYAGYSPLHQKCCQFLDECLYLIHDVSMRGIDLSLNKLTVRDLKRNYELTGTQHESPTKRTGCSRQDALSGQRSRPYNGTLIESLVYAEPYKRRKLTSL
jgi:hypothetical protein